LPIFARHCSPCLKCLICAPLKAKCRLMAMIVRPSGARSADPRDFPPPDRGPAAPNAVQACVTCVAERHGLPGVCSCPGRRPGCPAARQRARGATRHDVAGAARGS
jgi:hypothetical protein